MSMLGPSLSKSGIQDGGSHDQHLTLLLSCLSFVLQWLRFALFVIIGTFRSEDEDDYEYEFSVLSMRIRFGSLHLSKSPCSEQKTLTRSRPCPPI